MNFGSTPSTIGQENFSGDYSNIDLSVEGKNFRNSLYNVFVDKKNQKEIEYWEVATIRLIVKSENTITAQYLLNNSITKQVDLKGKMHNGYFSVRRKISAVGFPFIFYMYHEKKLMLGLLKDNSLIVKAGISRFGMIFIISGGNNDYLVFKYKKI